MAGVAHHEAESQSAVRVCEREGIVTSAHAVHHRHPIEESTSKAEMRKWAFMWDNLVSVCDACHAKIHKEERSHSKEAVKARAEQRHERWKDNLINRFIKQPQDNGTGTMETDSGVQR